MMNTQSSPEEETDMITDTIERLGCYLGLHRNLDLAIKAFESMDIKSLPDGRHEIRSDDVYMNLMQSSLGAGGVWEAHKEYIDLQIILEHEETIAWAPVESIGHFLSYDSIKDISLSRDPQPGSPVKLNAGMFAVFFPEDAHQPGIGAGTCRKAVFKIRKTILPEQEPAEKSLLSHKGTADLASERLKLRQYRIDDAETMYANWCSDDEVTRHLLWNTHSDAEHTKTLLADWIAAYSSGQSYHWAIEKDGEVIGDIAVMRWSGTHLDCEIGYCLSRKFWNQGIMTEALRTVMKFLFEEVGFHRIILRHYTENPASGKVMQKAGLKVEGVFRKAMKHKDGNFVDLVQYAALRDEWQM
jgi:YhcH/YjgK/YiaL family protein